MLVGDFLTRAATWYADKTASVDENTRVTYAEFNRRTNSIANALLDSGIKPQDRVAIICQNCHNYMEIVFACAKIGAVATNLNWRLSAKELALLLNHSDAKIVFYSKRFENMLDPLKKMVPDIRIVAIGGSIDGADDYEKLIETHANHEPSVEIKEDDTFLQIYTSGTTGTPKGVMLTHKNCVQHAVNTVIELQMRRDTVHLNFLPLFHVAIYLAINCVFVGGKSVFMADFDPEGVFSSIEREKVTSIGCVPSIVKFLVEHPKFDQYDLSSIRLVVYAAAPMPVLLLKQALMKLKCEFAQVFGMTETSPVTHILIPEEHVTEGPEYKVKRLGSVGRPIINVQSKVIDEYGNECPVGVVGEVVDIGDTIMKGYYKMPEATAETIKDGWLHTGDMGYLDEYGYLYLADRKKDTIISGGENIYPTEVEMCIMQMDGVDDVAVIGIPDEVWGELVKAIVVRRPGADLLAEDVISHCMSHIARYKRPKSVDFVDALPRNAMGKIQKNTLREPYWAGRDRKI